MHQTKATSPEINHSCSWLVAFYYLLQYVHL